MTFRQRATRAALAIGAAGVLAAGVAACGDDEGTGGGGGGGGGQEQVTVGLFS